jgi:hypothetical protein
MICRFSSTTRISASPLAKARTASASSGHGMPTFITRTPRAAARSSLRPSSTIAWRRSDQALPQATTPRRARGDSTTTRLMPLAPAQASAA